MILTCIHSSQVNRPRMIDPVQTMCLMQHIHVLYISNILYDEQVVNAWLIIAQGRLEHSTTRQISILLCLAEGFIQRHILISTVPDKHADSDCRLPESSSSSWHLLVRRKLPNLFMGSSRPHVQPEDQPYPPDQSEDTWQRSCLDNRELKWSQSKCSGFQKRLPFSVKPDDG